MTSRARRSQPSATARLTSRPAAAGYVGVAHDGPELVPRRQPPGRPLVHRCRESSVSGLLARRQNAGTGEGVDHHREDCVESGIVIAGVVGQPRHCAEPDYHRLRDCAFVSSAVHGSKSLYVANSWRKRPNCVRVLVGKLADLAENRLPRSAAATSVRSLPSGQGKLSDCRADTVVARQRYLSASVRVERCGKYVVAYACVLG